MKGVLALEDGRVFEGVAFGAGGVREGEIVFNTTMTGYQEVLTDPSYNGQIVAMTYPLIGNYGTNEQDVESDRPQVEGFVVRQYCPFPSNFASRWPLADYLAANGVVAVTEVDTRALTRHVRDRGAMRAVIAAGDDHPPEALVERARAGRGLVGVDLVRNVTCPEPYVYADPGGDALHAVVLDFGVKRSILRCLAAMGMKVTVVPARTTAAEVLALRPDGVLLSNGPGDPEGVPYAVRTTRELIGRTPLFGICLGHEFIGLALGGVMRKLKFGHRGANHPVRELATGRVCITCQNHGFNLEADSFDDAEVEVTHLNLNDMTAAGLRHRSLPVASVQYHPEASAGPHDARYLFGRFEEMMRSERNRAAHA
ncbi:MAG: glutamine-hydrolyzing carbamoyl-phosphate synthase small subunit [Candidatus Brocadiaceae bacterium]|nr:glutamine-hydrolyzing carbamoyl-phosphate synthase small subunit [Candidatus Brocadiaceae bacterium]